jgi:hypothetical protein
MIDQRRAALEAVIDDPYSESTSVEQARAALAALDKPAPVTPVDLITPVSVTHESAKPIEPTPVKKKSLLEEYKDYIASKPYVETPEERERLRKCAEEDAKRRKLYDKGMDDYIDRLMKGGGYEGTKIQERQ